MASSRHTIAIDAIRTLPADGDALVEKIAHRVRLWLANDYAVSIIASWNQENGPSQLADVLAIGAGNAAYELRVWEEPRTYKQTRALSWFVEEYLRTMSATMIRICGAVLGRGEDFNNIQFGADIVWLTRFVAEAVIDPQFSLAQVEAAETREHWCIDITATAIIVSLAGFLVVLKLLDV